MSLYDEHQQKLYINVTVIFKVTQLYIRMWERPIRPETALCIQQLRRRLDPLRPTPATRHSSPATFIHRDLKYSTHIIPWQDAIRRAFDPPYSGPHKVIVRTDKTFKIVVRGQQVTVSADRVKPAYILEGTQHDITTNTGSPPAQPHSSPATAVTPTTQAPQTTSSGRSVHFPARFNT